ncbi:MAG: uncharacterized protein QOF72_1926 [Blastocatellia bacterium]|jgi:uncharacterized DUF497 family protein|nr:uncharacterized protein [Blastocatellia bacterium]
MRFEWDETKRRSNIRQHGIDFVDAEEVFAGETITFLDDRYDYGETRFLTFGLLWGEVVAIVHIETDKVIRVISVRRASKDEEETYFTELRN